jgi:pimeloyl-ACP methyl ester carboxylesterase
MGSRPLATAAPRRSRPVRGHLETRSVVGVDLEVLSGGQGQPLVILHDQEYLNAWQPFLEGLAASFQVVVPSHPGFGGSALPEEFDSIDDLAFFYLSALRDLAAGPVHLLGLGIGGWIAVEMAVRCTHQLRRLVLADSVGIKVSGRTERDVADNFVIGPEALVELTWHDPRAGAERMKLPGVGALDEEELVLLLRNRQSAAMFTWKPFMHNPKLRARLARIDIPTLVLWGDDDRVVTPAYGRTYAESIPGARFETIPAAGHYPYLEQPERFVAAIVAFLREVGPPAHARSPAR